MITKVLCSAVLAMSMVVPSLAQDTKADLQPGFDAQWCKDNWEVCIRAVNEIAEERAAPAEAPAAEATLGAGVTANVAEGVPIIIQNLGIPNLCNPCEKTCGPGDVVVRCDLGYDAAVLACLQNSNCVGIEREKWGGRPRPEPRPMPWSVLNEANQPQRPVGLGEALGQVNFYNGALAASPVESLVALPADQVQIVGLPDICTKGLWGEGSIPPQCNPSIRQFLAGKGLISPLPGFEP